MGLERQAVTDYKNRGTNNNSNLWATDTMGNAKYPLELLLRVIPVSLETKENVNGMPRLRRPV